MWSKQTQISNLAFDDFRKLWKFCVSIPFQYIYRYWELNDTHAIIKQEVLLHLYDLNNSNTANTVVKYIYPFLC